jgi:myo-inositol catabolism protein IolC
MVPQRKKTLVLDTFEVIKSTNMTSSLGFDKPLYIFSFDHRGAFLGASDSEMLNEEHAAQVAAAAAQLAGAKHVGYDGFEAALAAGVPKDKGGILVDEQFGSDILEHAAARGYLTACPAERPGQAEFDFEYGEDFAKHIEVFHPTFCEVKVRYNPEGDQELNKRQVARLKRLSDYLHGESRSLFLLELLLPPEQAQLQKLQGNKHAYNMEVRPRLMVEAIKQLQDAQVEPDVWGVEGIDRREDCEKVVAAARRGKRDKVSCITLGGGADQEKLRGWLKTSAEVPGFIGFAVGRTIFVGPISRWIAGKTPLKAAVAEIAQRYREFVNIFEADRKATVG